MTQPLVSVIVPAYNSGPYLAETLSSVCHQTYPAREIIVVDDGSTDDTPEQIEPYRRFITYIRQDNSGPGAARNRGLRAARGDYLAFLDHDDLWLPRKLETQLEVARHHPESGMVVCDGVQFDGETILLPRLLSGPLAGRLAGSRDGQITDTFYRDFIRRSLISCPAQTLIPRHVVDRIGPMTTSRNKPADWEYYLRIALVYPITFHRDSLVRWRYLPSSRSGHLDRRHLNWGLMAVPMLKRHARLCPVGDRPLVMSRRRANVRECALGAYYYGRQHDVAYARSYLARLLRRVPGDPFVVMCLAALYLPTASVDRVVRWRQLWRRMSSGASGR